MKYFALILLPIVTFATTGEMNKPNYDIVERTINFIIFFSILYYLAAKPLKSLYMARIECIANRLKNVEEKLRISKTKKSEMAKHIEKTKINAAELVETAKKETVLIQEKIAKEALLEMENMQKNFEITCEFETRQMNKTVVKDILDKVLDQSTLKIEQKEMLNIISKKVS